MYNETTFMMMQVVVFFSGVIAGAGIFYFLLLGYLQLKILFYKIL